MSLNRPLVVCMSLAAGLFALAELGASDWPQWRGPKRDGLSAETGLLKEWPKEGPKLLWHRKDVGSGYSTPSVAGERLFLLSNKGVEEESIQALQVKDGSQVWSTVIGKVGNPAQKPAYPACRSTATVEGENLYALGSDGDLVCLETATGKLKWKKSLRADFAGKPGTWAYAESPLIDGDALICSPGGAEATVVALEKKSGAPIWKAALKDADAAGYASPIVAEIGGVKQYVLFLAKGLVGIDAKSGTLLWRYEKTAQGSPANIPTPIAFDGFVYSAAGRSGAGLVKLKVTDGVFTPEEVYFTPKLPTSIGGAVRIGELIYGTNGSGLLCAELLTGNVKWQDRSIGAGSVCYADGLLYLHGESGAVAIIEATPDAYREKGRFTPPGMPEHGNSKAWAYPVISDGRLYIRDLGALWCYDLKPSPAK